MARLIIGLALPTIEQIDEAGTTQRENDTIVIMSVKKKIVKKIFKMVAGICFVFALLFIAVVLYTSISYPVTKDNIALSTETDGEYTYIVLETEAGKSLSFDSKNEDIFNDQNEVCGQKITLYNLKYHNNFTHNTNSVRWGSALNDENRYIEMIVELEDGTLQIVN